MISINPFLNPIIILTTTITTYNLFTAFFVFGFIILGILLLYSQMRLLKKNKKMLSLQQQYAAKIDQMSKDHFDELEKIRTEVRKHDEERNYQWIESEKETLTVLNGLSTLLTMNENFGVLESEKILKRIQMVEDSITSKINSLSNDTRK